MAQPGDPSFGWGSGFTPGEAAEAAVEAQDGAADGAEGGTAEQSPREVAVDAPGASRTYTYAVPPRLAGIEDGEAVLVEFGRSRQALGVVLGPARGEALADVKPILARVRADGPLLPRLTLDFARWLSEEYLAPPAATLRSMLPPGMLERLELVAERLPGAETALGDRAVDREEAAVLERLANGARPVRDVEGADGRAATLRRLRAMASRGLLRLEWTLTATVGPRFERWLTLTDEGRGVAAGSGGSGGGSGGAPATPAAGAAGAAAAGSARLGPRQRALLDDLAAAEAGGAPGLVAAEAAGRHGSGTATGLIRRGLV
ncbi:MAG: hypothetical protein ABSB75_01165, partial [Candidatus Limnocylindrales bacterium]